MSSYLSIFGYIVILFDVQQMLNQTPANNYHKSIYIEVHLAWRHFIFKRLFLSTCLISFKKKYTFDFMIVLVALRWIGLGVIMKPKTILFRSTTLHLIAVFLYRNTIEETYTIQGAQAIENVVDHSLKAKQHSY